jgi:hypothetical protein
MFELQVLLRGRVIGNSCFDQDRVRIGRSSDNDVFIDNPVFSRSHAVIQRKGIVHLLQDLNSANGTFLNGSRVSLANLNDGDRITIGKFTLVFSCPDAVPIAGAGGGATLDGGATMKLDPRARAEDLERHAQSRARLVLATGEEYPLQRDVFLAGSERICDLRVGGWRTPRLAMVARGYGGFSLVNIAGRDVLLNGKPVEYQAWLRDGDALHLAGVEATFIVEKDADRPRHAPTPIKGLGEALALAIKRSEQRSKILGLLDRWFERNT